MAAQCTDAKAALKKYLLPKPFVGKPGCDFSFSGLKTAARRMMDTVKEEDKPAFCCAFQETVAMILADRIENAIDMFGKTGTLVVAGGVAANKRIRGVLENLATQRGLTFSAPPLKLCTDNAAMIAWAGVERLKRGMTDSADFAVRARWPLDPDAGVVCVKSQKV
jgi:N6-L-threonylcarbamoyladenine synthase